MTRGLNVYQPLRDLEEEQRARAQEAEASPDAAAPDPAPEAEAASVPVEISEEQRQETVLHELAERSAATREHSQGGALRADLELMAERDSRAWAEEHRAMFPEGEEHDPAAKEQHIAFGEQRQDAIYHPDPYLQEIEPPDTQAQIQEADPSAGGGAPTDLAAEPEAEPAPEPSVSDYQGWGEPEEPSRVSAVDPDQARRDGESVDDYHGWAPDHGQDHGHER